MPMGTTSYLFRSMAFRTEAADSNDTSCSPLRPPKRIPTRNFLFTNLVWTGKGPLVNRRNGSRRVHKGNHKWFAGNLRTARGGVVCDLASSTWHNRAIPQSFAKKYSARH